MKHPSGTLFDSASLFTLVALLLILLIWVTAVALAGPGARRRAQITQRIREVTSPASASALTSVTGLLRANLKRGLSSRITKLGERAPMLDPTQRAALHVKLTQAGFRDQRATSMMVGLKLVTGSLLGLAALAFAPLIPRLGDYLTIRLLAMAGAFVIGLIAPEYALLGLVRRRKQKISSCLPDALDLLVICTNAGNSLAVSIKRVAHELRIICPPLADEYAVTADEMHISADYATALRNLAARVNLPSVHALATTLIQSQEYGTPITQALRTLSRTERTDQLIALEEKAAKLSTKITLPMLLFIIPTVALIAAGPAVIRLMSVFHAQ